MHHSHPRPIGIEHLVVQANGGVTIDALAPGVLQVAKKPVNFCGLEEAGAIRAFQLQLAVAADCRGLVGQHRALFPTRKLRLEHAVVEILVGERPHAAVGVDVAQLCQSGIQTFEHGVEMAEKETFRVGEHGYRLGQVVEEATGLPAHFYGVERGQMKALVGLARKRGFVLESDRLVRAARSSQVGIRLGEFFVFFFVVVVFVVF